MIKVELKLSPFRHYFRFAAVPYDSICVHIHGLYRGQFGTPSTSMYSILRPEHLLSCACREGSRFTSSCCTICTGCPAAFRSVERGYNDFPHALPYMPIYRWYTFSFFASTSALEASISCSVLIFLFFHLLQSLTGILVHALLHTLGYFFPFSRCAT